MLVKDAKLLGNISTGNSKMPGTTFAIDAFSCITGSKLAKQENTPCYACYARKLQKLRPSVDQGWKANLRKWQEAEPAHWERAMVYQIKRYNKDNYHRWFDSGDLQSVQMLKSIARVCEQTPNIKHWLPTQERAIVSQFKAKHTVPENLIIRVSASLLNGSKPSKTRHASQVFTKQCKPKGYECKARSRSNSCGPCRACWDKSIPLISYPKH